MIFAFAMLRFFFEYRMENASKTHFIGWKKCKKLSKYIMIR